MARSKINRKAKANANPCNVKASASAPDHITPAFLGHRCPQDVQNAINFHRGTLTDEVCTFLLSNPPNLKTFVEFWSRPQNQSLTSSRAADTICGASWMLALNYLFLNQVDAARVFMLNGAFIHQCAHKSIVDIVALCQGGSAPLCDHLVDSELPYYNSAFVASHSRERTERYLQSVLPMDLMLRMSFASHAGHKSGSSTWVKDYVNHIGDDWSTSSQPPKHVIKGSDESSIHLTFLNTESNDAVHLSIGVSHMLKELFTKYSEDQDVPLRSLRFVFEGKPLFMSCASNKTPEQLGMRDHDVICVSSTTLSGSTSSQAGCAPEPQKKVQRKKSTKRRCNKNNRSKPSKSAYLEQEDPKVAHSQVLSKLFEEAEPQFKVIRQQLNNLTMERTLPKTKSLERKASSSTQQQLVFNPNTEGLAGKAGKTSYVIHVGEVNNLYKSSKKSRAQVLQPQMIDLHGYTQHEALQKLDESLPIWEKYAMEGSYPFVAPVVIICGGGNQILSETVSYWIKENNVSNAPSKTKNTYASAA
ncbi:hypothetical protein ACHAXN_004143 [Cyclotella atomus]